jgi:hypothetical protein
VGPKKQQRADRFVGLIHSRQEQLIQTAHTANRILLTDNERRKLLVKFLSLRTFDSRIQEEIVCYLLCSYFRNHDVSPFVNQIKGFIFRRLTGNDFLPGFISWKCRKCEPFGKFGSVSDLFGVARDALSGGL